MIGDRDEIHGDNGIKIIGKVAKMFMVIYTERGKIFCGIVRRKDFPTIEEFFSPTINISGTEKFIGRLINLQA